MLEMEIATCLLVGKKSLVKYLHAIVFMRDTLKFLISSHHIHTDRHTDMYRVIHQVSDLGWVVSHFDVSLIIPCLIAHSA